MTTCIPITSILVVNALKGALPLVLRKRYPSARISCAEVFPFFRAHLIKLGFEVTDWDAVGDMKFDLVIGNPPYQSADSSTRLGSRGESAVWPKFVTKSLDLLNPGGYLNLIHPTSWRKPHDRYGLWTKLTKENQMLRLIMKSGRGDQDHFGIGVRVDSYLIEKTPKYTTTNVTDHEGKQYCLDLDKFSWLSNYAIDEISQYLGRGTEVLYNTYYHTQKPHADKECKKFPYPVVHTINKDGLGIKYFDSLPPQQGIHFGRAKVLLNQNELQYPYNDYKGEYGMSQLTFGIAINNKKEGDQLVKWLNSEQGKRLIAATKWNTFYTDYGMFEYFKKDFFK